MTSISFFTPIIYKSENKTSVQTALEYVDEYFYFGGRKACVCDFNAITFENDHRTWMNVALKISSYCTIIFPLLGLFAKTILRSILKINTDPISKILQKFVQPQKLEDRCKKLIEQGNSKEALELAKPIFSTYRSDYIKRPICEEFIKAGKAEEALTVALSLDGKYSKKGICRAFIDKKMPKEALELAKTLTGKSTLSVKKEICNLLKTAGMDTEATELAKTA